MISSDGSSVVGVGESAGSVMTNFLHVIDQHWLMSPLELVTHLVIKHALMLI